jgi:hypothetical protein
LLNLSARTRVQTNQNVGIGGFIISGNGAKKVILRGMGPSLKVNGAPVPGALSDPVLELHDSSGATILANDNWRDGNQEAQIQQSGLAPPDDKEAALIATLTAGNYTAVVRGAGESSGIGLVEIYDLQATNPAQLGNLSARAFVNTGDEVLINGIILAGGTPKRVLFRAIGPELTGQGVDNALQDTTLELHDGNGALLGSNDDWMDAPNASEIENTGLAPTENSESAILMTLPPGNYTGIVRGANNTTGIGLAEAYKLD